MNSSYLIIHVHKYINQSFLGALSFAPFKFLRNLLAYSFIIFAILNVHLLTAQSDDIKIANEYYQEGELEKAKEMFEKLAKNQRNIPLIHSNYFKLLLDLNEFKEAGNYVKKIQKAFSDNIYYQLDEGILYDRQGDHVKAAKKFRSVIDEQKGSQQKIRLTAQYLINNQQIEFGKEAYLAARKAQGNPESFSLELANVYRYLNKKDHMVEEYLNFAGQNPSNISYVKKVLQSILTETEDLISLESMLIDKVQKDPDEKMFGELLVWVNIQLKNFYGAFIQARAMDKRFKERGNGLIELGKIALENKDYENSITIFQYVTKEYKQSHNYILARRYLITTREEQVKNSYPVKEKDIRSLITEYENLFQELGINNNTLEALRSKAMLHAFYLDEKSKAVQILNQIIEFPRVDKELKSQCKLDLGDIYILIGEPWESTLLYSQVEKAHKDTGLAYEAKLKNAKLSYYKGDFELSKSHLDVLKLATSREIANDAMHLSLLIGENIILDTTNVPLQRFAHVDLLMFQNKHEEALDSLNSLAEAYSSHMLADDIHFRRAELLLKKGRFEEAIKDLQWVVDRFGYDILADDAYFMIGEIYHYHLKDPEMAMKMYREFLDKFPGSIFASDARKRFRQLRGDQI